VNKVSMRCPSCNAENANDVRACTACGARLPRKNRRRSTEVAEAPATQEGLLGNPVIVAAYRCMVLGLVPPLGLLLGPAALVLAFVGFLRSRASPTPVRSGPAFAVMALAAAIGATQWGGLALILYGLST
jgi:hypothetical protein